MMEVLRNGAVMLSEKADAILQQLEAQTDALNMLEAHSEASRVRDEYQVFVFNGVTDGVGSLSVSIPLRPGYEAMLTSVAGTGFADGGLLLYVNDESEHNLAFAMTTSLFFSEGFPNEIVIPQGATLIARFRSQTAASPVSATVRARKLPIGVPSRRAAGGL